jgi:hypothetical protein
VVGSSGLCFNESIMVIEHFILANSSSIDMNTNSLSVFGILDDMQIQAPPGMVLNLTFHSILVVGRGRETGPIQTNFKMTVYSPDQKPIGKELVMPLNMDPNHRRARLRVITEIPVSQSGNYTIKMEKANDPSLNREVSVYIQIMPVSVPNPMNPQSNPLQ